MTGPRRLVSTDPAMRAATLAACAMGKYDIEDSCTLDAKNEDLKLPHLRWRYHILSSDMCLTYVFPQCSCMGIWFVIQMLEFQEILAMNRFYHLRGNDSWCFAMREVYKWSIHKPSPPTVCKHLRSAIIPSQGHWGSPIHGLLAVLHVLNPSSGSDVWGNVYTLRGCLAYGLRAAEATKLLAEPPFSREVWMLTWNQVSWKIQKNRWFSGVYIYIYCFKYIIYIYICITWYHNLCL